MSWKLFWSVQKIVLDCMLSHAIYWIWSLKIQCVQNFSTLELIFCFAKIQIRILVPIFQTVYQAWGKCLRHMLNRKKDKTIEIAMLYISSWQCFFVLIFSVSSIVYVTGICSWKYLWAFWSQRKMKKYNTDSL